MKARNEGKERAAASKEGRNAPEGKKVVASNRKARYDYEILEVYEAGLSLVGAEVKSLRAGKAVLEGSFARSEKGELYLYNMYIAPYSHAHLDLPDSRRTRKLLMRRVELKRLAARLSAKAVTIVPLQLYFKHGWAKVELALAKGKKGPDRRETLRKKEETRELERSFKGRFKL